MENRSSADGDAVQPNAVGPLAGTKSIGWVWCPCPRPSARLRLICVPHGGGAATAFRPWIDDLPAWIELLAVAQPGRGARFKEAPVGDLQAQLDQLVPALAPHLIGPYALFGHSTGALIAYELARRLVEAHGLAPIRLIVSAHPAPQRLAPNNPRKLHALPDQALWQTIGALGLLPSDMPGSDELRDFIISAARQDFRISETYVFEHHPPLDVPITALAGTKDSLIGPAEMAFWQDRTSGAFDRKDFEGDHFFTRSHQDQVVGLLSETLADDLVRHPPSSLTGPVSDTYPLAQCLHEVFRQRTRENPAKTAIIDGDRHITYEMLDRVTDALALDIAAHQIGADEIVGLYMAPSALVLVGMIAVLKAGGAYMALDTSYPKPLLDRIIEQAAPVVVLADPTHPMTLPADGGRAPAVIDVSWARLDAGVTDPTLRPPQTTAVGPSNLAFATVSSGTTGAPKIGLLTHRALINAVFARYDAVPYGDADREAVNLFFLYEGLRPLLAGRCAVVVPNDVIIDPRRLVRFVQSNRVTRTLLTPSLFQRLLTLPQADLGEALGALREVILSGEVTPSQLFMQAATRLPNVRLFNLYGLAECPDVAIAEVRRPDPAGFGHTPTTAVAGLPIAHLTTYILDDALAVVPSGTVGEVFVTGIGLGLGYRGNDAETAARFLPNPFDGQDSRLLRTGDLGRILPNRGLEITGRVAFMITLRGHTFSPEAVETALCRHPEVAAALVFARPDPATGQPATLVAQLVPDHNAANAEDGYRALVRRVRSWAGQTLPRYAVPGQFQIVDHLPTAGANRKRKRAEVGPEIGPAEDRPTQVLAELLAELWAGLLGARPEAEDDNFFDLGGHSLLAVDLSLALETRLGVTIDVVDIFAHPTFAGQLRLLTRAAPPPRARQEQTPATVASADGAAPDIAPTGIAVIGLAGRYPGADTVEAFWDNLVNGACSIVRYTRDELRAAGVPDQVQDRPDYVPFGATVAEPDLFDPAFWGLSKREAITIDPQQRLFLEACWSALEHAGYAPRSVPGRVGVYAGCYFPTYLLHHLPGDDWRYGADPTAFLRAEIGADKDYIATRVSFLLGLGGPSLTLQTACSTGLVTIAQACQGLLSGACDVALAGASSLTFPRVGYRFVEEHIASKDGICRPFDASATGTVFGDGVGVVVLKPLAAAMRDHDQVYGLVKGFAVNNDGRRKATYTAPSADGQAEVLRQALAMAKVDPTTVSFLECHGTGTIVGDPIEVRTLRQVYDPHGDRVQPCALGSVKSNIGHANVAAGVAGFTKAVLALHHRTLPATLNLDTLNPALAIEASPFYVNTSVRPWHRRGDHPRRAGVTSLGIGGTNCHVVLEEAPPPPPRTAGPSPPQLLVLSGPSEAAVDRLRQALVGHLDRHPEQPLADVAFTLQEGRQRFRHRVAVAAAGHADAIAALKDAPPVLLAATATSGAGDLVFVFPDQGGPCAGMALGLLDGHPDLRRHIQNGATVLNRLLDADIEALLRADAAVGPDRTELMPPLVFAVQVAVARTLMDWGIRPTDIVSQSLGAWAGAVIAGTAAFEDAAQQVVIRRTASQPPSVSAASRFDEAIRAILGRAPETPIRLIDIGPGQTLAEPLRRLAIEAGRPAPLVSVISAMGAPAFTDHDDARRLVEAAGRLWQSGVEIDWQRLRAAPSARRGPLPTYPFDRERCWPGETKPLPTPTAHQSEPTGQAEPPPSRLPVTDWVYQTSWVRRPLTAMPGQHAGPAVQHWLVLFNGAGRSGPLARRLVAGLTDRGHAVHVVDAPPPAEDKTDWLDETLRTWFGQPAAEARVLYLWGLDHDGRDHPDAVAQGLRPLIGTIKAISRRTGDRSLRLWVVTRQAVAVGAEAVVVPQSALTLPARVLAQETFNVEGRSLDIAGLDDPAAAGALLDDLTPREPDPQPVIALRPGSRWGRRFVRVPVEFAAAEAGGVRIAPGGVYLVTGAFGRIGPTLTRHLLDKGANLVLSGRTPPSDAALAERLPGCRDLIGKRLAIVAGDLRDGAAVDGMVFRTVEQFGRLDGVFHLAGDTGIGFIDDIAPSLIDRHLAAKVYGTYHLDAAIGRLETRTRIRPKFVLLFSSAASVTGGPGSAVYAAVNSVLDAIAQSRTGRTKWLSIGWDTWDFDYGPDTLPGYHRGFRRLAMAAGEAVSLADYALANPSLSAITISTHDLEDRVAQWDDARRRRRTPNAAPAPVPTQTSSADGLLELVQAIFAEVFGTEQIAPTTDFFDLGGDSLSAVDICTELDKRLTRARRTTIADVFDHPTPASLAAFLTKG